MTMIIGAKMQLKLIILFFWTKFGQTGYFWSKTEKVNITIKFCIFKLVYNHGHNILRHFDV